MKFSAYLTFFIILGCNPYPKDTNNSYNEATTISLKLGIAINPPFTQYEDGEFTGSEIELIKDFAAKENLQVEFLQASESELMEKLEDYKIHIMLGGFDKNTIWKKKARPTATYDGEHVFLVPKGENRLLYELEHFIYNTK